MDLFRRKWLFMIFGCGVCVFFCIQIFMVFNGLSAIKDSISSLKATMLRQGLYDRRRKGIILCLHDGIVGMGVSLIKELRCLGNQETIEVHYCLPGEISERSKDLLTYKEPNVVLIDTCTYMIEQNKMTPTLAQKFRSYWIKPLALYATNLTDVILLDGDDLLLSDPSSLRDLPLYKEHGTIFFYDRIVDMPNYFNKIKKKPKNYLHFWIETFDYQRFGIDKKNTKVSKRTLDSFAYQGKTCHEQDSSMVLINKAKAGRAMEVLFFLITEFRLKYSFSWGDKESFWLAYEFAQEDYAFSPWGIAALSSSTDKDLEKHPNTLCGNMAHYVPINDSSKESELLYINGKTLLEPHPYGLNDTISFRPNRHFNLNPSHITPRQPRKYFPRPEFTECMMEMGAELLPKAFFPKLIRRRMHYMAIEMNYLEPLDICEADIFSQ